jgi:hypothetical protein
MQRENDASADGLAEDGQGPACLGDQKKYHQDRGIG